MVHTRQSIWHTQDSQYGTHKTVNMARTRQSIWHTQDSQYGTHKTVEALTRCCSRGKLPLTTVRPTEPFRPTEPYTLPETLGNLTTVALPTLHPEPAPTETFTLNPQLLSSLPKPRNAAVSLQAAFVGGEDRIHPENARKSGRHGAQ